MNSLGETVLGILIVIAAIVVIGWVGYNIGIDLKPTAMDVYKCKTALEITYKDGVAIDSVVVFKNKEEHK